jgi:peptidoglycan/LPS O-acetylase OafA/YrhL
VGATGARRVPALDGLRGVAVTLVVLSHAHLTPGVAGPLGVSVFFVLSGYLITGLLLGEVEETGTVGLRRFWCRRLLRLAPALLVMVTLVELYVLAVGYPVEHWNALVAATYTENIAMGVFGNTDGLFTHTWTLGLEEQFYLLWPLVIVAAVARRRLVVISLVVAVVSLLVRQVLMGDVQTAYSSPPASCYPLAFGCALAASGLRLPRWAGSACLLGVVAVACFPGPGGALWAQTLVSVFAVGVLAGPPPELGWAPAVWLGRRSYSLYLWQAPVLALLGPISGPFWLAVLVSFPLTIGAACASYRWIETPGRKYGRVRYGMTHSEATNNEVARPTQVPAADRRLSTSRE